MVTLATQQTYDAALEKMQNSGKRKSARQRPIYQRLQPTREQSTIEAAAALSALWKVTSSACPR